MRSTSWKFLAAAAATVVTVNTLLAIVVVRHERQLDAGAKAFASTGVPLIEPVVPGQSVTSVDELDRSSARGEVLLFELRPDRFPDNWLALAPSGRAWAFDPREMAAPCADLATLQAIVDEFDRPVQPTCVTLGRNRWLYRDSTDVGGLAVIRHRDALLVMAVPSRSDAEAVQVREASARELAALPTNPISIGPG
jgi:hypothetical protein